MSDPLIAALAARLTHPLPGLAAQLAMTSRGGPESWHMRDDYRESAVLALLYPHREDLHLVFMQRTLDGRVHSGQISFPGGSREATDRDLVHTALREAEEELGIVPATVRVLGQLTPLYIPPSNFMVYPTVGYSPTRPTFVPDPQEVAGVIEASVSQLRARTSRVQASVQIHNGLRLDVPAFRAAGHIIWGATAMMLNELLAIIEELGA